MSTTDEGVEKKDQQAPAGQEEGVEANKGDGNEPDPKAPEGEIDYKAELEKQKEISENYKQGMLNAKDQLEKKGKEPIPVVDPEVIAQQVEEKVAEKITPLTKELEELREDRQEAILDTLTSNPDKRELIKFHYENSIKQSGSSREAIRADLMKALALADAPKVIKENAELKETMKQKQNIANGGSGSNQDKPDVENQHIVKVTAEEEALLKRRGLSAKDVKPSVTVETK